MPLHEIPWQEWPSFTEFCTQQHEGWLVTVELARTVDSAAQEGSPPVTVLAEEQPLRGLTLLRTDEGEEFWIAVGDEPHQKVHKIADPARLVFQTDDRGAHRGVRIDSVLGEATYVSFRTAALPDELDGIA